MKYNSLLFGNGLTLNLLYQLQPYIPENKCYLLSIDSFLKEWIKGGISQREENKLYTAMYGKDKYKHQKFEMIKDDLNIYFQTYSSDLEYFLGAILFDKKNDLLNRVKTVFPLFYNAWWIILAEYLEYQNLNNRINNFYQQVAGIVTEPGYIYTTNFDLFGESIHPEHLHGRFVQPLNRYEDVIFHTFKFNFEEKEEKNFRFKYIWGHNGIGKRNLINKLHSYSASSKFFDFGFFFNDDIKISNMLIYGMGFKNSGYISQLQEKYPRYQKAAFGGIIDEHILVRICGLQESGKLNQVDVTYYDEGEREHLHEVLEACMVPNYRLINCQDFNFHV